MDVATKALIKRALGSQKLFSQISINEYIRRGEELEEDEDKSTIFKVMIQSATLTHPFTTTRVKLLQEWAKSKDYERLLDGDYNFVEREEGNVEEKEQMECPVCSAVISVEDNACKLCGHSIFKTPPICPECFRDLKPQWDKCPHCNKSFQPSKTKIWVYGKIKDATSFVGDNIKKINPFTKGKD